MPASRHKRSSTLFEWLNVATGPSTTTADTSSVDSVDPGLVIVNDGKSKVKSGDKVKLSSQERDENSHHGPGFQRHGDNQDELDEASDPGDESLSERIPLPPIEEFSFKSILQSCQPIVDKVTDGLGEVVSSYRGFLGDELEAAAEKQRMLTHEMKQLDKLAQSVLSTTVSRMVKSQSTVKALIGTEGLATISEASYSNLSSILDLLVDIDNLLPPQERLNTPNSAHKLHYPKLHSLLQAKRGGEVSSIGADASSNTNERLSTSNRSTPSLLSDLATTETHVETEAGNKIATGSVQSSRNSAEMETASSSSLSTSGSTAIVIPLSLQSESKQGQTQENNDFNKSHITGSNDITRKRVDLEPNLTWPRETDHRRVVSTIEGPSTSIREGESLVSSSEEYPSKATESNPVLPSTGGHKPPRRSISLSALSNYSNSSHALLIQSNDADSLAQPVLDLQSVASLTSHAVISSTTGAPIRRRSRLSKRPMSFFSKGWPSSSTSRGDSKSSQSPTARELLRRVIREET
ncbi:hypothetical protein AWJ20_3678 [Sugiyamaella lignohabitans]|uniref:BLOC-1-related complex subunit 5 n=1 Tax=Sugiyamaella lignohabitans TaxID=796027 RepID=A0A170QZX2_9ASCO|nr:uncharacterized protein AWJ20_3678 [Sugiyamaella lignohabitans]ANB16027.1 hypothetical protein AWJ20_3678 [Sugiyamaella lignohabitans]